MLFVLASTFPFRVYSLPVRVSALLQPPLCCPALRDASIDASPTNRTGFVNAAPFIVGYRL
jgi:hypothetical protein